MTVVYRAPSLAQERTIGDCDYCGRACFQKGSRAAMRRPMCVGTRDHVVPRMLRTQETWDAVEGQDNIVLACAACNHIKGSAPPEAFRAWRKEHPDDPSTDLGLPALQKQFNIYLFALTEIGWRRVRDDAAWGPPAKSMAELVAKVRRPTAADIRRRA